MHISLPADWHSKHLPQTDSTMLRLKEADDGTLRPDFFLLTTDFQTAGRGQRGNSWISEAGKNLLFGFSFHPQIPANQQFLLSETLALAVAGTLAAYVEGVCVKWPNDVYVGEQKICGMLLEHDLLSGCIQTSRTGVGLNVNQTAFPSSLPNPVSLALLTGREFSREALLENIIHRFCELFTLLSNGHSAQIHNLYMQHLYRSTGFHPFRDKKGDFQAAITDISSAGLLLLTDKSGKNRTYAFKEVEFI